MRLIILIISFILGVLPPNARGRFLPLDVNDVSFLLPQDGPGGKPHPYLPLNIDLISEPVFMSALTHSNDGASVSLDDYIGGAALLGKMSNWLVTSVRYVDCDGAFENSVFAGNQQADCVPRLRMVAQPYEAVVGSFEATAIHLSYFLNPQQKLSIEQDLFALKEAAVGLAIAETRKRTLNIHPVLQAELRNPKIPKVYSKFLLEIIKKYATNANLEVVTLTVHTVLNSWDFFGGLLANPITWQAFQLTPQGRLGFERLVCDTENVCLSPQSDSLQAPQEHDWENNTDLLYLFNEKNKGRQKVLLEVDQKIAENIHNMGKTHFQNTSCIACHVADAARNSQRLLTNMIFSEEVTPFVLHFRKGGTFNEVINFGYQGTAARISLRTATDSALVVKNLNKDYKTNPTPILDKKNINDLWECLNLITTFSDEICLK